MLTVDILGATVAVGILVMHGGEPVLAEGSGLYHDGTGLGCAGVDELDAYRISGKLVEQGGDVQR